jgi:predicted ester cyclase
MSTEENKALLRRAWDEVYGQGRLDSIEEFVLDDVIAHEPDGDVRGAEGFKRYLATYLAAFPDTSVTVEDVIAEGDKVVSRYTVRGTHKGTTEVRSAHRQEDGDRGHHPLPLQGWQAGGDVGPLRQPGCHAAAGAHAGSGVPLLALVFRV